MIEFLVLATEAAVAAGSDPLIQYVNYGVLGLTVVMFILGKVVPGFIYDRAEKQRVEDLAKKDKIIENQNAEIARLNNYIADEVIPAIIRFTDLQAKEVERRVMEFERGRDVGR